MSGLESLRHDLHAVRQFARRLKEDVDDDPVLPPLPEPHLVELPGRGEVFLRRAEGPPGATTVVLLHGWALSSDLNWFSGVYDVASRHGPVLAPDMRGHGRGLCSDKPLTLELLADDVAALVEDLGVGPVV